MRSCLYGVTYLLTLLPFSKVCLYSELEFFLLLEEEGGGAGSIITGSLLAMAMAASVVLGFLEFETKGEGRKGSY